MKPIILIPAAYHPDHGERLFANLSYTRALEEAGAIPLLCARPTENADIASLVDLADGLFLMGGLDAEPPCYGKNTCKHVVNMDSARDTLEFALLSLAEKKGIPVLGICRGMQIMNIHRGGTLFRDIEDERPDSLDHERHDEPDRSFIAHTVAIKEGTLLGKIITAGEVGVNSLHHQGVDALGDGVTISATATDGLPEALERADLPFWLAVQWHPEELGDPRWKKLFSSFVRAAGAERGR